MNLKNFFLAFHYLNSLKIRGCNFKLLIISKLLIFKIKKKLI